MRAILACLIGLLTVPVMAQDTIPYEWRLLEAIKIYRAGDTPKALELLGKEEVELQRLAARQMIRNAGRPLPPGPAGPAWTIPLLTTVGALHMEAPLAAFTRQGTDALSDLKTQIEIAEILLDGIGTLEDHQSDAARWEWAIGQQAMAIANFEVASTVLFRACKRYPEHARLLLACGTADETYASVNPDSETALRAIGGRTTRAIAQDPAVMGLLRAQAGRTDDLKHARQMFERVLTLEPSNAEALLRLGHVRLKLKDVAGAAATLEPVSRSPDSRTAYLARLLLGRVREMQQRTDDAVALFREAVSVLPAQSARVALANRMLAEGRNAEARQLAEAVAIGNDVDDPWWSYRNGQYWLVKDALEALRAEARR